MHKNNKAKDGSLNICGKRIRELRQAHKPKLSIRLLADLLQEVDLNLDRTAIERIEKGKRAVNDVELKGLAEFFGITTDELLE